MGKCRRISTRVCIYPHFYPQNSGVYTDEKRANRSSELWDLMWRKFDQYWIDVISTKLLRSVYA